jgi:hypothetical protein
MLLTGETSTTSYHSLFKVKAKVDIQPYHGEINVVKLNQWLQQLKVYFGDHDIGEEQKISFSQLKFKDHT